MRTHLNGQKVKKHISSKKEEKMSKAIFAVTSILIYYFVAFNYVASTSEILLKFIA